MVGEIRMKKWMVICLSVLLLSLFSGLLVTADGITEVTAIEAGYENVLFSNEYRGFCVDEGLAGAEVSDKFTVCPAGEILNNNSGANVSNQLKVMMTKGFDFFFEKNQNGMYEITPYGLQLAQRVAWYYTDDYVSANYKTDIEQVVQKVDEWVALGITVADEGYVFQADETTNVQMDFVLLNTQKQGQQCFFAYHMTQTTVEPSQPPAPPQPEPETSTEIQTPTEPNLPQEQTPTQVIPDPVPPPGQGEPQSPDPSGGNPTVTPPERQPEQALPQTGDSSNVAVAVLLWCLAVAGLTLAKA